MTLSLTNIEHGFSQNMVLHNITFSVKPGSIHALLGMNGAGKSTLMHIAAGVYQPNRGIIEVDKGQVNFKSPADAVEKGIVFLTQEVDRGLVQGLSVYENLTVYLNKKSIVYNRRFRKRKAKELLEKYNMNINIEKQINQCSLYEKQIISIIRAISNEAKYLLLDEPTASFDRNETEKFYTIIHQLKEKGIGMVLITHRLNEILENSNEVTILRDGKTVLQKVIGEVSKEEMVQQITGSLKLEPRVSKAISKQEVQFEVKELQLKGAEKPLNFDVRVGEIVVFFGLLGSGKTTVAETLFGIHHGYTALLNGEKVTINNPTQSIKNRLALIPEERGKHGIWKESDIRTHLSLHFKGWINKRLETDYARMLIDMFEIRPNLPTYKVGRLSGGNQQKVAIAKWYGSNPKVMIFDEPMKGIDVAAKEKIFQTIEMFAGKGTSTIYLTSEPEEAIRIADRIIVLSHRKIIGEYSPTECSIEQLMQIAEKEEANGTAHYTYK